MPEAKSIPVGGRRRNVPQVHDVLKTKENGVFLPEPFLEGLSGLVVEGMIGLGAAQPLQFQSSEAAGRREGQTRWTIVFEVSQMYHIRGAGGSSGGSGQVSLSPARPPEGPAISFRVRFRCTTDAPWVQLRR